MKLIIENILKEAVSNKTSDIIIAAGTKIYCKLAGQIKTITEEKLSAEDTEDLIRQIYTLDHDRDMSTLLEEGDDDFSFSIVDIGRFRCNAYKQRGSLSAVLRVVAFSLPDPEELFIPPAVLNLCGLKKGLILVTGAAGSGKSTTLACMVDRINNTRPGHIITIEDPIEFLHPHNLCVVSQREIAHDTMSYQSALRAALRQAPDTILLGEMRDFETIHTVITAAETGQLVLSTLHTIGAAKTIDRVIDVFPPAQQQQIRIQLSMVLQAVVSQQLIPSTAGGLIPAFEIMVVTPAIRNMIRESKVYQMDNVIYAGADLGMRTMDADLQRLFTEGKITKENALAYSVNPETLKKKLG
ncbi:MAG: type IV pilus twitching motility protein PilT [Oscillospiraceae bacterium]|jgi:twitching motility protein PilT|nr:type IV pilus twitching motility protein PilT [Oscillospiraceae bacterium]